MTRHRIIVIVMLFSAIGLLSSCSKKMSTDEPLPPVYYPSVIISSDNQFVYSFDPYNGFKHWEYNVGDAVVASPMVYNEMVYISTLNGVIFKLNSKTGALVTKFSLTAHPYQLLATPIADGKLIYFGATNDTLYAVDTGTGSVSWKFRATDQIQSSPTIHNGQVIVASHDGKVYSMDEITGTLKWTFTSTDSFYSSPAVTDSFVYIGGLAGTMYELRVSDGAIRWKYPATGNIGAIRSSPTIYGGNCIFGSNDYFVYCVDTQSGAARWIDSTHDRVIASPCADVNNQLVIAASYDYNVYAYNIINGSIKWVLPNPNGNIFKCSPLIYAGIVFIGDYQGYFYAIDSYTGEIRWRQNVGGVVECSPVIDNLTGISYNSSISGYSN